MKSQMQLLATCPFCRQGIGLYFDLRNLLNYRLDNAVGGRLDTDPVRKLFVFDAENRIAGPCPHLFDVLLEVVWDPAPDNEDAPSWGADFDLVHPVAESASEGRESQLGVSELVDELIYGPREQEPALRFVPRTECRTIRTDICWPEYLQGLLLGNYSSSGRVCFVRDIGVLCEDLRNTVKERLAPPEPDERQVISHG